MRLRGGAAGAAAVLGMVLVLTGCEGVDLPVDGEPSGAAPAPGSGRAAGPLDNPDGTKPGLAPLTSDAERGEARALIAKVATKGRGPRTGYDRDEFGYAWMDSAPGGIPFARNGCDTRIISMLRAVMDLFSQRMQGVVGCG